MKSGTAGSRRRAAAAARPARGPRPARRRCTGRRRFRRGGRVALPPLPSLPPRVGEGREGLAALDRPRPRRPDRPVRGGMGDRGVSSARPGHASRSAFLAGSVPPVPGPAGAGGIFVGALLTRVRGAGAVERRGRDLAMLANVRPAWNAMPSRRRGCASCGRGSTRRTACRRRSASPGSVTSSTCSTGPAICCSRRSPT